jgi:hypothetical protein
LREPLPELTKYFVAGLIDKSQALNQPILLLLDTYEKASVDVDN